METTTAVVHIAEMAHIIAASKRGPRGKSALSTAERGAYENLILLCSSCHTLVDKVAQDFPDTLVVSWKQSHREKIAALFGVIEYSTRSAARVAVEPLMAENRQIFETLGPDNPHHEDPESELALRWARKVLSRILPNNRKVLTILDANRKLLTVHERSDLELFRQHVIDLEARHLGDDAIGGGTRYPEGMNSILKADRDGQ